MSCCGGSASRSSTGTVGRWSFKSSALARDHEFDPLDLTATRNDGDLLIPESTHIRLAAAASNEGAQILRRPYSYNDGVDFTIGRWPPWRRGVEYDAGLLFVCYQRDYGREDSAILPPSAIPQYRPRRCKPTATREEPGSVEWLIAQSEGVRRSMSMKKRAEPQHADPSQATGARKSGDNPASPLPRTGSSNPLPSSGASANFRSLSGSVASLGCLPCQRQDHRIGAQIQPRAAMWVATSTRAWPSRKPASARSRCGWDLLP
jgi:hypothetical protein